MANNSSDKISELNESSKNSNLQFEENEFIKSESSAKEESKNTQTSESFNSIYDEKKRVASLNSPVESTSKSSPNLESVAASPPRFVALDEIMKAANGMSNVYLLHQIALNKDFQLKKPEHSNNNLKDQVEITLRKAYWKILESQLNESPPNFKQALSLLQEIKEYIFTFLLPQHAKLKQEIEEIIDLDLIKQQAENGVLNFQRYAQYILSVMARLCAPIRDEKIRELTQSNDVIYLFKGIMELLELMKLDMANFTIEQMRPQIVQHSVEYERNKFNEFLKAQSKLNIDGLENTKIWLKRNKESLESENDDENKNSIINRVMISAYVELLSWNYKTQAFFPETVAIDEARIKELQKKIYLYVTVGSVLLVTFATASALQNSEKFKISLKEKILSLLNLDTDLPEKDKLESVSLQVLKEINEYLVNCELPPLDSKKETELKYQIEQISSTDNRIRTIIHRRILEFVELVLTSKAASTVQIPTGLSVLQEELLTVTSEFVRLVTFNRSVFEEIYKKILVDICS